MLNNCIIIRSIDDITIVYCAHRSGNVIHHISYIRPVVKLRRRYTHIYRYRWVYITIYCIMVLRVRYKL